MKSLLHIRNSIYGQPWAIRDQMLDTIAEEVEAAMVNDSIAAAAGKKDFARDDSEIDNQNGVDIIPVSGPIAKKMNLFSKISGGTSVDELNSMFTECLANKDSSAICFLFDSPGGSVSGIAELGSRIYSARQSTSKPIIASIDGMCASAAYWLASQCDAVYLTEASVAGNIGVIAKINNTDRAQKNAGNDPIIIKSSELKGIGEGPVTPNQHQALADVVSTYFGMFKAAVARGRGDKIDDIDEVADARDFIGLDAVNAGLCDGVMTMADVVKMYGKN